MLRGPRNNDSPVTVSAPHIQILVSKHHSPLNGARALWRNTWFQDWGSASTRWVWNTHPSCQEVLKFSEKTEDTSYGQRNSSKGFLIVTFGSMCISTWIITEVNCYWIKKIALNILIIIKTLKAEAEGGKLLFTGEGLPINIERIISGKYMGNTATRWRLSSQSGFHSWF